MENIHEALFLLVIGLITVFVILLVVIYFGKLLIVVVNKYFPEEEKATAPEPAAAGNRLAEQIIAEAVKAVTNGRGRVEKIEKI